MVRLEVRSGTYDNYVIKPMLEKNNVATDYEPYKERTDYIDLKGNEITINDELRIEKGTVKLIKNYNTTKNVIDLGTITPIKSYEGTNNVYVIANVEPTYFEETYVSKTKSGGLDGKDGVTPNISIGTVTTLDAGQKATVTRTGTDEAPVLNFGIPKGEKGDSGEGGGSYVASSGLFLNDSNLIGVNFYEYDSSYIEYSTNNIKKNSNYAETYAEDSYIQSDSFSLNVIKQTYQGTLMTKFIYNGAFNENDFVLMCVNSQKDTTVPTTSVKTKPWFKIAYQNGHFKAYASSNAEVWDLNDGTVQNEISLIKGHEYTLRYTIDSSYNTFTITDETTNESAMLMRIIGMFLFSANETDYTTVVTFGNDKDEYERTGVSKAMYASFDVDATKIINYSVVYWQLAEAGINPYWQNAMSKMISYYQLTRMSDVQQAINEQIGNVNTVLATLTSVEGE